MEQEKPKQPVHEIRLDSGGRSPSADDWNELLREMEAPRPKSASRPVAPAPPEPVAAGQASLPPPAGPLQQIDSILAELDQSRASIEEFMRAHPYLVAPNVCKLWIDSLRETHVMLSRQRENVERRLMVTSPRTNLSQ